MNNLQGKQILWLDDEIDRLVFEIRYLEKLDIRVFKAPLTSLAINILKEQSIDIIITDNQLMSDQPLESYDIDGGVKFIQSLRSGYVNKLTNKQGLEKIPIVLISSFYRELPEEEKLYFLSKPLYIFELIELLKQIWQ